MLSHSRAIILYKQQAKNKNKQKKNHDFPKAEKCFHDMVLLNTKNWPK